VPYELKRVDFQVPTRMFVQATPNGKIPVVEDGDVVVFESGAIVEYLLERYGQGRLAPSVGSPLRAQFLQWMHYAEGTAGRAEHLKDERTLMRDIRDRTLPPVTFYKPIGTYDEHPGYADLVRGDDHAASIIHQVQNSFIWDDTVIIVTYAGNGGIWDHVAPPKIDQVATVQISTHRK